MTDRSSLGVRCPCGLEVTGVDERDLTVAVNHHLSLEHSAAARSYDVDDVAALAYRLPNQSGPTSRERP